MKIGIDAGAGTVKAVLLEENISDRKLVVKPTEDYPVKRVQEALEELSPDSNCQITLTGTNAIKVSQALGYPVVLDAIAVLKGTQLLYPDTKTVFDIGAQSSSLWIIERIGDETVIADYGKNNECSAGTGALIERMAKRSGMSLEDFVGRANSTKSVAPIANRCSVFAQSDFVHTTNGGGMGIPEAAAGICRMPAKNFKGVVCLGKNIQQPIIQIGGVAQNPKVHGFLEDLFDQEIFIPPEFLELKAIGAAEAYRDAKLPKPTSTKTYSYPSTGIISSIKPEDLTKRKLPYVIIDSTSGNEIRLSTDNYKFPEKGRIPVFLGLDIGSVSAKGVLFSEQGIIGVYQQTQGQPFDAAKSVIEGIGNLEYVEDSSGRGFVVPSNFKEIPEFSHVKSKSPGRKLKDLVEVLESAATGSGREAGAFVIGGFAKNEITAQAAGARHYFPKYNTGLEFGGQDCKWWYLVNGVVVGVKMNKSCAASTGAFLAEQATRLGLSLEEFQMHALSATKLLNFSQRCAVFMSNDLGAYHDEPLADRCMSVIDAVCGNYLNSVAEEIGDFPVLQGAVAFNLPLVERLQQRIGRKIYVPKYPHLTGAIGIAKIASEAYVNSQGVKHGI